MRHLLIPFLLCACSFLQAQSPIHVADSLSANSQYLASNALLENFLRENPRRLHDQSKALFLMSYNYMQLGNFQQSEKANERSIALRDQLMSGDIAENYMRTGTLALLQGNYEKALDHLFIATTLPIEEPSLYALIYGYIASAFEALGQPEKALTYYRQAAETLLSATENSEADIATNYYNIGRVYLNQNKLDDAKSSFQQALGTAKLVPSRKDLQGNILNALGETMRQDTPSVAAQHYQHALNTYRGAYGERHREVARTYLNMGQLYFTLQEMKSAEYCASQAIKSLCAEPLQESAFPQKNIPTLDRLLLATALHLRAELLMEQGAFDLALAYGKQAATCVQEEVMAVGEDASRLRKLAAAAGVFESGIQAAYLQYQNTKDPYALEAAFEMAEQGKAILLRMNVANADAQQVLSANEALREAALRAKWRNDEALMALKPEDAALRRATMESREQYALFVNQMAVAHPAFAKARGMGEPATVAQLRTQFGEKDAVLSYFIGEEDYYIFALTQTGIVCKKVTKGLDFKAEDSKAQKFVKKMIRLQENPLGTGPGIYRKFDMANMAIDLDGAVKGFLQSIKKSNPEQFTAYAQLLYERLIQPIDSMLKGKDRLLIVPHKNLFAIPFEALISGFMPDEDKSTYTKLNYLIQSYTIQYSYGANLATPKSKAAPASGVLSMAPVFDNNSSQSYIWDSNLFAFDTTYQGSYSMRSATADGLSFQALPESEREALDISKLFAKKKRTALAYLRIEANESNFKAQANKQSILHLATHSFVNYANPALSGIAFSQPNISRPSTEDGVLYAGEIAGLNLQGVDLVTLSSCESGSGPDAGNEGALSLTHGFLSAGAPNVLSSLWKVYDSYTAQLMQLFYDQTLSNKGYAQALRHAKLKMIKDSKSADPRKWSGFVLFGSL